MTRTETNRYPTIIFKPVMQDKDASSIDFCVGPLLACLSTDKPSESLTVIVAEQGMISIIKTLRISL